MFWCFAHKIWMDWRLLEACRLLLLDDGVALEE